MYGKCLCGSVEFEISGELPGIYQCHCSLCRKVSGSSSNSAMLINSDSFSWISSENQIIRFSTPTGFKSEFCGKCGSPVPNETMNGEYYWVPAGLLEEPLQTKVAVHVYVGLKSSWDTSFLDDSIPQYPEMPDVHEFMELLHGRYA